MSRNYSNVSPQTALVGAITNVATAAIIADDPIVAAPFTAVITPTADKAGEEIVLVTSVTPNAGDFDLVITRAFGGTAGVAHLDAAKFQHVVIDDDINGLQEDEPPNDLTWGGRHASFVAGETVAFGDVCYMKSDGSAWKSDASAVATLPVIVMAGAAITATNAGNFILPSAFVRNDAWAWTVGGLIYASLTAGALTQTAPSATDEGVQVVGVATHADRMYFNPEFTIVINA